MCPLQASNSAASFVPAHLAQTMRWPSASDRGGRSDHELSLPTGQDSLSATSSQTHRLRLQASGDASRPRRRRNQKIYRVVVVVCVLQRGIHGLRFRHDGLDTRRRADLGREARLCRCCSVRCAALAAHTSCCLGLAVTRSGDRRSIVFIVGDLNRLGVRSAGSCSAARSIAVLRLMHVCGASPIRGRICRAAMTVSARHEKRSARSAGRMAAPAEDTLRPAAERPHSARSS